MPVYDIYSETIKVQLCPPIGRSDGATIIYIYIYISRRTEINFAVMPLRFFPLAALLNQYLKRRYLKGNALQKVILKRPRDVY